MWLCFYPQGHLHLRAATDQQQASRISTLGLPAFHERLFLNCVNKLQQVSSHLHLKVRLTVMIRTKYRHIL